MTMATSTRDIFSADEPFRFGTKAETLARLRAVNSAGLPGFSEADGVNVLEQVAFTIREWRADRRGIVARVLAAFPKSRLVVRSSSRGEDGGAQSMAGAFDSVVDIAPAAEAVDTSINRVVASYGECLSEEDQVLVQPMAGDIAISGVVFSREINTGADYYVVNYDDFSGRTDTVTGGQHSKLFFVRRGHLESIHSDRFFKLLRALAALEAYIGLDRLDLEFGIDTQERLYVFQVRPLTTAAGWREDARRLFHEAGDRIRANITNRLAAAREDDLLGSSTILGDMPDWNPAEILGNAPPPLSIALYREIVTDSVWAKARAEMGYRDLTGDALLVDLEGRCFIDVRKSLNSFLPHDLDQDFGAKLVDHQLSCLADNRHWHDKIEFKIALTALDFSTYRRLDSLIDEGFVATDIANFSSALGALTARNVVPGASGLDAILSRQDSLGGARAVLERIIAGDREPNSTDLAELLTVPETIAKFGTLPFAILARHGFIAVLFLRSMAREGYLSDDRADQFMRGVHTITTTFVEDLGALGREELDRAAFLARYGHLRPGTYDIRSPRYDEAPDLYLSTPESTAKVPERFTLMPEEGAEISKGLARLGMSIMPEDLIAYMERAIQYRELSKFTFTKTLSDFLRALTVWGNWQGLNTTDLAFTSLEDLRTVAAGDMRANQLKDRAGARMEANRVTQMIRLPSLIVEPEDIDVVRYPAGRPNFVTGKRVAGRSIFLDRAEPAPIDGKVVLIESADPGFDWIFSHPILGLVTKFGGANSHMAIRCAEFGVPAAIGCGERLFESLTSATAVELDCGSHIVKPESG